MTTTGAGADLSARAVVDRGAFRLDVALHVAAGEVVAVIGPNGAGKTTLLRALSGLTPLDDGLVRLGVRLLEQPDHRVRLAPQHRRVGLVPQDHRLFPHLSALENVAFGPRSTGVPRRRARADARARLDRLGLAGLGGRRPGELSGGQAQRVALARALATDPDLLLLDEPLAALDAGTREGVREQLRGQLAAFAGPVLLVTHDLLDALALAGRVVVLEGGRVVQDASTTDLTRRPLTAYVARLVGLVLLGGTAADGVLAVDADRGGGRLAVAGHHHGRVLAAVRPSDVRVSAAAPDAEAGTVVLAGASTRWTARVRSAERLVDRLRLRVEGSPSVAVDVHPATAARLDLSGGQRVALELDASDVEVYPAPGAPPGSAAGA